MVRRREAWKPPPPHPQTECKRAQDIARTSSACVQITRHKPAPFNRIRPSRTLWGDRGLNSRSNFELRSGDVNRTGGASRKPRSRGKGEGITSTRAKHELGVVLLVLLKCLFAEEAFESAVVFGRELLNDPVALFTAHGTIFHGAHDLLARLPLLLVGLIDHGGTDAVLAGQFGKPAPRWVLLPLDFIPTVLPDGGFVGFFELAPGF